MLHKIGGAIAAISVLYYKHYYDRKICHQRHNLKLQWRTITIKPAVKFTILGSSLS